MAVEDYVAGMRQMWGLGDYTGVARLLHPAAEGVVAQLPPGARRVLDLAAGTGNVAALAAVAGASVDAADLSPRMVELGRGRTAGLDVTWHEADAEDLPFPDGSYDAVLSAFGIIFVPRPDVALAQARRVLGPGGRLALAAWTPTGFVGEMTTVSRRWFPAQDGVADLLSWGDEPVVRRWLADSGFVEVTVQTTTLPWHFDSPAAMTQFFLAHSPSHIAGAAALGERAAEMHAAVERIAGEPGRPVRLEAEYLLVSATAPV